MTITIRPARQEDQQTIVSYIQQAKLNPRNLHWERFLVAEENGQIIGIRQVKVHAGGTREVGSGFVLPEYRRQGISARLMNEMMLLSASLKSIHSNPLCWKSSSYRAGSDRYMLFRSRTSLCSLRCGS